MDLSIIIISYNVKEKLRENLRAIFASSGDLSWEVLVVDNNSHDGSAVMVKDEFPQVKLIANSENLGFAKANNQALSLALGKYLLLLNPDMRLFPDAISNMVNWGEVHETATVFSGQLVDSEGRNIPHVRRFPKLADQLAIALKLPHLFPSINKAYLMTDFDYRQAQKVDSVRGSFFFINRESWQKLSGSLVPLLDERYFIWFEEVDFCRQVSAWGGEVWYTPVGKALDYVGQSFSQVSTCRKQKYFSESMIKYFSKWHSAVAVVSLKLAWFFSLLICRLWKRK